MSRGDRVPGNHMLMPTLKNAIPNGHAEISQIQRYHRAYNKHILFIIYRSKVGSDRTIVELHRWLQVPLKTKNFVDELNWHKQSWHINWETNKLSCLNDFLPSDVLLDSTRYPTPHSLDPYTFLLVGTTHSLDPYTFLTFCWSAQHIPSTLTPFCWSAQHIPSTPTPFWLSVGQHNTFPRPLHLSDFLVVSTTHSLDPYTFLVVSTKTVLKRHPTCCTFVAFCWLAAQHLQHYILKPLYFYDLQSLNTRHMTRDS